MLARVDQLLGLLLELLEPRSPRSSIIILNPPARPTPRPAAAGDRDVGLGDLLGEPLPELVGDGVAVERRCLRVFSSRSHFRDALLPGRASCRSSRASFVPAASSRPTSARCPKTRSEIQTGRSANSSRMTNIEPKLEPLAFRTHRLARHRLGVLDPGRLVRDRLEPVHRLDASAPARPSRATAR